jgi:diguanylate cyclase (GGDEF)-like protein
VRERTAALDRANEELERLASQDALTGLPNRRVFFERAESEWKRALRDRLPIALVMLDIDRFKQFNDRYGHLEGDGCLRRVAAVLAAAARRPGDLAARYGGEEFTILLPNTTAEGAERVARAAGEEVFGLGIAHPDGPRGVVTVSAGVASVVPEAPDSVNALLGRADEALYRAKEQGRARVVVAPPRSGSA